MAEKGRFIIRRNDQVARADDVIIESEGLTLGRVVGNDLVLNHRSVSRTHAGIKQLGGEYWLFNLSTSNGTLLNGQLVARAPIADGDTLQIGPYFLKTNYVGGGLTIAVEIALGMQPVEGPASQPQGGSVDEATVFIDLRQVASGLAGGATARFGGASGLLTGVLPALDEQALNVFWEKRKREAGKLAAKTLLHPKGGRGVGKAQFNWRPTLDLRGLWRKSYFAWGVMLVGAVSIAAIAAQSIYYSPGRLSDSHASSSVSAAGIALTPNANSCFSCHSVTVTMQQNCVKCHTTQTFQPTVYDAHEREGMQCITCHSEHQGASVQAGLIAYGVCSDCHNGSYKIKKGDHAGNLLPVPHGGSLGYPVVDGKWVWKGLSADEWRSRGLSESLAGYSAKDQFHLVHQQGRMAGRMRCTDCHTAGVRTNEGLHESPRNECAKCHGISFAASSGEGTAVRVQANCSTCHQQHGESKDLARLVPPQGAAIANLKQYVQGIATGQDDGGRSPALSFFSTGGAGIARQDRTVIRWGAISNVGALPWYGWLALALILPLGGFVALAAGSARAKMAFHGGRSKDQAGRGAASTGTDTKKFQSEGPSYPHPEINSELCIGCHACVEACPHDVLAIVNGIATPVALDQCMEDTGCQVECPTSPKACIVVNTKKKIPARKVPNRDQRFMTNVEGIYLIGDVSGVPLIKNAINEGAQVLDYIIDDLAKEGPNSSAEYDVTIIGIGPAGLSATAIAKQRGLRVLAIEQDKVVSTIQSYPAGKYVFFKPDTVQAKGGVALPGPGQTKETMLAAWMESISRGGLDIHEEECCVGIKREPGVYTVTTEKGKAKERVSYLTRRVILAVGNRGTPMKLNVPGEEIKLSVPADPKSLTACVKCGGPRRAGQKFCPKCGSPLPEVHPGPVLDDKVKYKLLDPDDYRGKKMIVVGAGNSAIEAAVDLCGLKRDGETLSFTRDNEVTLVVRSDFKGDLKLGNKMNVYDCMDAGKIKVFYRTAIKEIKEKEVVLMDARSKEEKARLVNDYVIALIGGEKPTKFLESLGIKIGG